MTEEQYLFETKGQAYFEYYLAMEEFFAEELDETVEELPNQNNDSKTLQPKSKLLKHHS